MSPEELIAADTDTTRQRFAVFDFDGTIISEQSSVIFVKFLMRSRIMPPSTLASMAWWGFRYKLNLPYRQNEVRQQVFSLFADMTAQEVDLMIENLYDTEISKTIRPPALESIRTYQNLGVPVIIVSASFEPIVRLAAKRIGAYAQLSTKMEVVDGRYTGNVSNTPCEGYEKRRALTEFLDGSYGKDAWRLVAAYGDHHTDIPLLELSERPVAVNSDTKLARVAAARGWEIVHW